MGQTQIYGYLIVILTVTGSIRSFNKQEKTLSVKVGETIHLPCRIPLDTRVEMIQWQKGEDLLTLGRNTVGASSRLEILQPAPDEVNLALTNAKKSDNGFYTCQSNTDVFAQITLLVEWKPEIIETESSRKQEDMIEGSTGQLRCLTSGQPKPNITWHRRAQREKHFQPLGITGNTLTIHNISRYGSDVYMCNASNVHGFALWEMNVTVHFPVEVSILESDLEVAPSDRVALTCAIQGSPLHGYYWQFNGKEIGESWKYLIISDHETGYPLYFLTLAMRHSSLEDDDFGNYSCRARGPASESERSVRLIQKMTVHR